MLGACSSGQSTLPPNQAALQFALADTRGLRRSRPYTGRVRRIVQALSSALLPQHAMPGPLRHSVS